jgi:peptidoglycan/LPS O-acetylase OafA/YrhL
MLVLWVHVSEKFEDLSPVTKASSWVHALTLPINAGRIGVVMFFAISGFVVPFSIKLAHRYPVREFLVTRFFRLYPAYWLSIPFGVVTTYWIFHHPFSLREFLVNLTMLEYLFHVRPAIGLYWTLAVEFVFYVCCVALVLARCITNYRVIGVLVVALTLVHVIGAIVIVQTGSGGWYETALWPLNLAVMFWGTLYRADMRGLATGRFERACTWGSAVFFVVAYPIVFAGLLGLPYMHTIGYSLGVLLFIVGTRAIRIELAPLPWLGLISYSIYLFHPVVFNIVAYFVRPLPVDAWWRNWHLGAYVLFVLLLTIAFAALVYRFVERPSIKLGRALARRWFGEPGQKVAPPLGSAA